MTTDPFSDMLDLARARSVMSGGFIAGGSWAIRFPAPDKIKFFALVKGACWLRIDGDDAPVRVETGDVFLLAAQRGFVLAGDLAATPVDATEVFTPGAGTVERIGDRDADDCVQIGGHVRLDPINGRLLLDVLPALIHVQAAAPQATVLRWLLDQLVQERSANLPGVDVASTQLAQLMFVQILRVHLATAGALPAGWLRAIGDARLVPVLQLMHGDPGRAWRLDDLAKAAAMSRTTFMLRFKAAAGVAPLTYLTEWRMRLAERALREGGVPVATLARSLGYTSESAFSNAFKRVTGHAPKRYRAAAQALVARRD